VLVSQSLPDLRHLDQRDALMAGREGIGGLYALLREATVSLPWRLVVRHLRPHGASPPTRSRISLSIWRECAMASRVFLSSSTRSRSQAGRRLFNARDLRTHSAVCAAHFEAVG